MRPDRRQMLALLGAAPLGSVWAAADGYPSWPVTVVVAPPPGSGADTTARIYAKRLQELTGQPFVVENRPGANSFIALQSVARAKPDGYTLHYSTNVIAMSPALFRKLPFDPAGDFAPIARAARGENVLVVPTSSPHRTLADLLAAARKHPQQLSYASGGRGLSLYVYVLAQLAGVEFLDVPYKGAAPGVVDTAAGVVSFSVADITSVLPLIQAGKLRPLVIASDRRHPLLPEVPTSQEAGAPGYEVYSWSGFYAPKNTPGLIVDQLSGLIQRINSEPETVAALSRLGVATFSADARELRRYHLAETARWKVTAERARMEPE